MAVINSNKITMKIPNWLAFLTIGLMVLSNGIILTADAEMPSGEVIITNYHKTPVIEESDIPDGKGGLTMTVGAFSDVECGSEWCNRHEPKDGQVALNYRKYGKVDKVYITEYDKWYRVVGNTYSETGNHLDMEIWFGQDRQAALEFGVKTLTVQL